MNDWLNRQMVITGMASITVASSIVLALATGPAFAQGYGYTDGARAENHRVEVREAEFENDWGGDYISEEQLLANALDLTEAELEEIYQKALELALDQAVTDGELTQAQADELKGDGNGIYMVEASEEEMYKYLAQVLSMSQADFDVALDGAIQKATDDGLITQAQANDMLLERLIEAKIEAAYQEALDEGVNQGLLTQLQADQMKREPHGGLEHDEEIVIMQSFGHGPSSGHLDFEFGPHDDWMDGFFEECIQFRGPRGMMQEECFDSGSSSSFGDFGQEFHRNFDSFRFFDTPGRFGHGWFRMP